MPENSCQQCSRHVCEDDLSKCLIPFCQKFAQTAQQVQVSNVVHITSKERVRLSAEAAYLDRHGVELMCRVLLSSTCVATEKGRHCSNLRPKPHGGVAVYFVWPLVTQQCLEEEVWEEVFCNWSVHVCVCVCMSKAFCFHGLTPQRNDRLMPDQPTRPQICNIC